MIRAVLFDLDGTLVNSLCDLANSVNFALQKFSFKPHETEKYKFFVGDGMKMLIKRALPQDASEELKARVFDEFFEHYSHHFADETTVYEGVLELLLKLRESGIKTAVVSNKAQAMCDAVTKKIVDFGFDFVCGQREGFAVKPDPALTLYVIEKLGVKPEECLFVGDSGMDMAVAKNSHSIGVGALWGFRGREELQRNGAKYLIENPLQLLEVLGDINEK